MSADLKLHLDRQTRLLGPDLKRSIFLSENFVLPRDAKTQTVDVIRSMPIEWVLPISSTVSKLSGLNAKFRVGDYDAAFSEVESRDFSDSDLILLWIDWRLLRGLSGDDAVDWLKGRIAAIRKSANVEIVFNNWPDFFAQEPRVGVDAVEGARSIAYLNIRLDELRMSLPGTMILDLKSLLSPLGAAAFDSRSDEMFSYPFTDKASITIGRFFGSAFLSQVKRSRMKALLLDMDNTLYSGVLGEGLETISSSKAYRELHRLIRALGDSGILLGLISKNEDGDACALFESGFFKDLKLEDFAARKISWNRKSQAIAEISEEFNFSTEDMLFVDDNPAEIAEVLEAHPKINVLLASDSAEVTAANILNYPRVFGIRPDPSAKKRKLDIQANAERAKLKASSEGVPNFLSQLEMKIEIDVSSQVNFSRVHSMSHKTNQFNLSLSRLSEVEVRTYFVEPNKCYTVSLMDKFADSGVVGAMLVSVVGEKAIFDEVLFSCRALGRGVEDLALHAALMDLASSGVNSVSFKVFEGPRNHPALKWLKSKIQNFEDVKIDDLIFNVGELIVSHPAKIVFKGETFDARKCP